jgi:hypothetical protein
MRTILLSSALLLAVCHPAAGQTPARWFVGVNGGAQSAPQSMSDHFEFQQNVETATADVQYPGKTGAIFDVGVGVRLWRELGAGIAVSSSSNEGAANVAAKIPHPFFFNRPRSISGDVNGVTRSETGVHIHARYSVAFSSRLLLTLSAGPSIISVEQDLASDVQYDEAFPYDTATFRTSAVRSSKATGAGFNVGVDVTWMFSRHLGVGGFARGTHATVDLETADKRRIPVDAGGAQGGAGLRLAF